MWVPFLLSFPGNEAHKLFFWGPNWGVLGGGQKVYVEKVYVLFPPLNSAFSLQKSLECFVESSKKGSQKVPSNGL